MRLGIWQRLTVNDFANFIVPQNIKVAFDVVEEFYMFIVEHLKNTEEKIIHL